MDGTGPMDNPAEASALRSPPGVAHGPLDNPATALQGAEGGVGLSTPPTAHRRRLSLRWISLGAPPCAAGTRDLRLAVDRDRGCTAGAERWISLGAPKVALYTRPLTATIDRMVLKSLHGDFFRLPNPNPDDPDGR